MHRQIAPLLLLFAAMSAPAQNARHFTFHYEFAVRNVEPGKKLHIWVPLAHSDQFQTVKMTSSTGDLPLRRTREREYGNEMLYAATDRADRAEYHFAVDYDVVRRERLVDLSAPS